MEGHRYLFLIIILGIVSIVWGGFLLFDGMHAPKETSPSTLIVTAPQVKQLETAAMLRRPEVGLPVRITIPSITVNADVIYLGLTSSGAIDVPKGPKEVAWFNLGPRPGESGTAIMVGHYGPWVNGSHSVFSSLDKLKPGDKLYIQDNKGKTLTFAVRESRVYDPRKPAPEVFAQQGGIRLNIITCNGSWLSSQKTCSKRLVVFTDLISQER